MSRCLSRVTSPIERRPVDLGLVTDAAHYGEIVERGLLTVQTSIWIATANVKDAHIQAPLGTVAQARGRYRSLFDWLKSQSEAGIDVRILHATRASRGLRANRSWNTETGLHRCCPRVHLKMVAVDGRLLYLGSANLTGAGMGAKSATRRNFEAGIVTDDPYLLDEMQRRFDEIWTGKRCHDCRLRARCPAPLDQLPSSVDEAPGPRKQVRPRSSLRCPKPKRKST